MERVLITGGTGFVGRATVRRLLDQGFAVRVLTRGAWPFEPHPRLEKTHGSMTNVDSLREATRECDAVVHLAARKNDEADSEDVNVDGTRMLCDAAKRAGVERVVYVSTQSAALKKRGLYGETKLRGERMVKESALPFVILRPSLVYGAADAGVFATIEKLCRLPFVPVFGNGKAVFRPVHVDDVADAIVAAVETPGALGTTLDIGGPDGITFDDLILRIQKMNGVARPILHLPVWTGLLGAAILRALPHPPVTRSNVLGGLETPAMDVDAANDILAISPRPFAPVAPAAKDNDAELMLSYVSGGAVVPTPELAERFRAACDAHGVEKRPMPSRLLLPYVDAASRIWAPRSNFRRSLLVAAAVAEATPLGAEAFLPRKRSLLTVTVLLAATTLAAIWYAAVGALLWTIPSVRRHAS
jgi:nucleoside-diphosphate-sugar epimerase